MSAALPNTAFPSIIETAAAGLSPAAVVGAAAVGAAVAALSTGSDVGSDGASSKDAKSGPDITQMDLLSGVPTVIAFIFTIAQATTTPLDMARPALDRFLRWLEDSIKQDFDVFLYSCTKECHTCRYELTKEALLKRLKKNTGVKGMPGCVGTDLVTVEDIMGIIQNGSGDTLLELAHIGGYTDMDGLRGAVRFNKYVPKRLQVIVLWQWIHVLTRLFIFDLLPAIGRYIWSTMRWFGRLIRSTERKSKGKKITPRNDSPRVIDYEMLTLAKHRIRVQHQPWVRFGTYYLLAELSKKPVSFRSWGKDDRTSSQRCTQHPALFERRLVSLITTDECSAARMLYVVSLLSIRTMLLCGGIAFVPAYLIIGAFTRLSTHLSGPMLEVNNSAIDDVFHTMYQLETRSKESEERQAQGRVQAAYSSVLKKLQSELGDKLQRSSETIVLLNLALADISDEDVKRAWRIIKAKDAVGTGQGIDESPAEAQSTDDSLKIAGIGTDVKSFWSVCQRQATIGNDIYELLESLQSYDIQWGTTIWLLQLFLTAYKEVTSMVVADDGSSPCNMSHESPSKIRGIATALCYSPFQPLIPPPSTNPQTSHHQQQHQQQQQSEHQPRPQRRGNLHLWHRPNQNRQQQQPQHDVAQQNTQAGQPKPTLGEQKMAKRQSQMPKKPSSKTGFEHAFSTGWSPLDSGNKSQLFRAPPAWCTCAGHCTGLCTLVVEACKMYISPSLYPWTPYVFTQQFASYTSAGPKGSSEFWSVPDSVRFLCSTNIDAVKGLIGRNDGWGKILDIAPGDSIRTNLGEQPPLLRAGTVGSTMVRALSFLRTEYTKPPPNPFGRLLYSNVPKILVASRGRIYEWRFGNGSEGVSHAAVNKILDEVKGYFLSSNSIAIGHVAPPTDSKETPLKATSSHSSHLMLRHINHHRQLKRFSVPSKLRMPPAAWRRFDPPST